jgi:hypothetical protein
MYGKRRNHMKKLKLIIILALAVMLVGCSNSGKKDDQSNGTDNGSAQGSDTADTADSKDASSQGVQKDGYMFASKDVTIPMNVDAAPIIEKLGDPIEKLEAPSCAFQGMDKIYNYGSFELDTYPNDGADYVSSVDFKDDTVSTPEGICIGSTLADVEAAYGKDYTEESGLYTYIKGDSKLTFIIKDDAVEAITYLANVEGLQQ